MLPHKPELVSHPDFHSHTQRMPFDPKKAQARRRTGKNTHGRRPSAEQATASSSHLELEKELDKRGIRFNSDNIKLLHRIHDNTQDKPVLMWAMQHSPRRLQEFLDKCVEVRTELSRSNNKTKADDARAAANSRLDEVWFRLEDDYYENRDKHERTSQQGTSSSRKG